MLERTLSTAVPRIRLRELVALYADKTANQSLKDNLLEPITEDELRIKFIAVVKNDIKGTPTHALIVNIIGLFTSDIAAIVPSPAINSMTKLNGPLKNILVGASSLSGSLLMLPVGNRFDKTGGIYEILALRCIAVLGMLGLTTLSSVTDLSTVDHFDYRFGTMLALNFLVGFTLPSFLAITNIVHWTPIASFGFSSSMYGGIGNLAPGLFLMLLQLSRQEIGLPVSFGLSTSVLALGSAIMAKYFVKPPYHQLIEKNIEHDHAVAIANLIGQERFPLPPDTNYWQLLKDTLNDMRAVSLAIASSSYGIYLASTITLYITLIEILKLSVTQAVITTGICSIWSTISNGLMGKPIDKYDRASGGTYSFCLSNLLTISGALLMAASRPLPGFAYTAAAQALIFTGTGISSLASIVLTANWAHPDNDYSKPYNNGMMGGALATIGQMWGILLPLSLAGFTLNNPTEGYQDFYYLIAGLATLSSTMIALTHLHLKQPLQARASDCWASMYSRSRQTASNIELTEIPAIDLERGLAATR